MRCENENCVENDQINDHETSDEIDITLLK